MNARDNIAVPLEQVHGCSHSDACDKVAFLCQSSLMEYGESARLFAHPETEQLQQFLGKLLEWNLSL